MIAGDAKRVGTVRERRRRQCFGYVMMCHVAAYNLAALIQRFDTKADTTVTGRLSSALGESILLDLLGHALATEGAGTVFQLPVKPHRDDSALDASAPAPKQRDLDAWLELDDGTLIAVECKHWTAASLGGVSVPSEADDIAALATKRWADLVSHHFSSQQWSIVNKIALPLKAPTPRLDASSITVRRVLAFWHPVSAVGLEPWSSLTWTPTWRSEPLRVDIFSASLYVRSLLRDGRGYVPVTAGDAALLLAAIGELYSACPGAVVPG